LTKEDNIYKKYTKHSIDDSIVNFLQSRDKWNFWNQDKVFFFKELSYMLKWWVGIVEAIETIRHSTDNYAVKEITRWINKFLHVGKTLSYALNRLPDYFDEWDYNVIKTWEKSWNMVVVLESLAQEYEYMNDIKNKYIWALIYPIILVIIAVTAVFALFGFVLPNIFDIADSFTGIDLPMTTVILRNISDFISVNRKLLVYATSGLSLLWWLFFSTETGKRSWFNILLSIPLIGKMTRYYYLVRRCRYMKLMLVSGMNYVETFKILRDVLWIPFYQDMIERILAWLQKWDTIYDSLKHESFLIPSNVAVLIKVGEETANLENAVWNVLSMYQEELNVTINRLAKVIEPIMLVFIWLIVVVIASWVFGLILQIMEWAWM
jgi:type II secretory pathway component PulF